MKTTLARRFASCRIALLLTGALVFSTAQNAQEPHPDRRGITTLVMGVETFDGVAPLSSKSRVRVPRYEQVTLMMPADWPHPIQWRKSGRPIPGATSRTFVIPLTASSDSGLYTVTGSPTSLITPGIFLDVIGGGYLGNVSARLELSGSTPQIFGFVAEGQTMNQLFIRAVGPSLRQFGIERPAARPRLSLFDAKGRAVAIPDSINATDWARIVANSGAFPLLPGASDTQRYYPISAGAYTIHVADDAGVGGTVLVEVYQLSDDAFPKPVIVPPPMGKKADELVIH